MKQDHRNQPPGCAIKLLRVICPTEHLEEMEGDIRESYQALAQQSGVPEARKQLIRQLFSLGIFGIRHCIHRHSVASLLNIRKSPYTLLLFTAVALLAALVFSPAEGLQWQDKAMLTIPLPVMVWVIPSLLVITWLVYLLTCASLYSRIITWLHVCITVITIFIISAVLVTGTNPGPQALANHEQIGLAMQLACLLFLLAQPLLGINAAMGIYRKHVAR